LTRALVLAGLVVAGCALVPAQPPPQRADLAEFALDARFALRVTAPGRPAETSSGRLAWEHRRDGDRILVANPLGVGIAEIDSGPDGARLRTADGRIREASDPDTLLEEVTGQRLPVRRLPQWLLGRGGDAGRLTQDGEGRALRLEDGGWQIDYSYGDGGPEAPPAALILSRPGEIELRLRIDDWRTLP
jgi:outer membrane lipoprotein LolB